jgi:hypothetical protein
MGCLDIIWMIVSPRASHALGFLVVRHDVVVVRELFVADCTFPVLLDNLPVQQFADLCGRPKFSISPRVMRVFDALDAQPHSTFFPSLFTATAEE